MVYGQQIYTPQLSRVNKFIIVTLVLTFLVLSVSKVSGGDLSQYLALSPFKFFEGHIYQILTYPFVNLELIGLIFNCLIIWFIGADIESLFGQKGYIFFLVFTVIGTALAYLIFAGLFFSGWTTSPLGGASSICYSLLLIYGLVYKDRILSFMLIFPMKAIYFCWILIAIQLYLGLFSAGGASSLGHLGGMLFAYIYLRYRVLFDYFLTKFQRLRFSGTSKKKKSHLYIVPEDERPNKNDPKFWQ